MAADNIDQTKLREYARVVAAFFDLPDSCAFAEEAGGAMLFDFSSRKACVHASQTLTSPPNAQQVCVMPVGDSLLEPL